MNTEELKGKTALVTGGSHRIGEAISLCLADAGMNIVIHYPFSPDETTDLKRILDKKGTKSWTVKADFAREEEYATLIERTLEMTGSLHVLINNASIFPKGSLKDVTFKDLVENIQVNAWAPFVLIRDFARLVGCGHVVNIIDSRITSYDWSHAAYILSKYMLAKLTDMTALTLAPDITINAVGPGLILPPPGEDEKYLDALADTVPMKKHGDPEYVARAVLYLVTSEYLDGQIIFVDGGRHLKEYGGGSNPHY
ncbi:MAG TPA: SDR family oxidoreductase [Deltaproteobacteria bacterium]|jgi:hypothetical protein|nr:SDR family oxidoreductase [Deltaproteobacteria bacterium]HQI00940.1 SDR family oxidoreductase [Deltaproteobacteria bacterium]HQJ07462.1 SDR family oxidoreductase [Deltaproteobacteria bacterium]